MQKKFNGHIMTMTMTMNIVYFDTKQQLKIYKLITIEGTEKHVSRGSHWVRCFSRYHGAT